MYFTENKTTTAIGSECKATVIADTIWNGNRVTTFELIYPRYIHSELMTHRMFSRNAASSRARPISANIDEVINDPAFFDYVGLNQKGMIAGDELKGEAYVNFQLEWENLGCYVANRIQEMAEQYNIHKQTLNRALEPWLRIRTLVTATEWNNFFKLRIAPDAQPEMCNLAKSMLEAMKKSKPAEREVHAPYIEVSQSCKILDSDAVAQSVARCARVSYSLRDGKQSELADDLRLFNHLREAGHMSPFEHVAHAADGWHANFYGWQSYRNALERS